MTIKTDTSLEINALAIIADVAKERSASDIAAEAQEVRAALLAGRFNVAVVGQFKRGKSTLINALIGRELLPSDIAPITSTITVLQHGYGERCLIIYADGREEEIPLSDLGLYASEEGNPGNQKRVRIILIELPVPLLESGLRLVDTPGVGSVFEPNSETTRAFLPRIDVALVILGSDPPITGDELSLIESLKTRVDRFFFVMNKGDLIAEPNRQKAEKFTRHILKRSLGQEPDILIHSSALKALRGEEDQGVQAISAMLSETAFHAGRDLARQSAISAIRYLAGRLIQQIELEIEGLTEPLSQLDENIARFQSSMNDIGDLMLAVKIKIEKEGTFDWNEWTAQKEDFIVEKSGAILSKIENEFGKRAGGKGVIRKAMMGKARQETKLCVNDWASCSTERFDLFYEGRLAAATDELNRLTSRVSDAASQAFGIPITHFELQRIRIESNRVPFEFSEPALALDLSDLFIPVLNIFASRRMVIKLSIKRARVLVNEWLLRNLYRIDENLINWLDRATRSLTSAISKRLDNLQSEILKAVSTGRVERQRGETVIAERLADLEKQRSKLATTLEFEKRQSDRN